MLPRTTFTKIWLVKNVGSCTWTTSYALVYLDGEQFSTPTSLPLPMNVAPGQTIEVSINMIAPSIVGSYRGYWIFKNASGSLFGAGPKGYEALWVEINVFDPTPTPTLNL